MTTDKQPFTLSNFRLEDKIDDWPIGRMNRTIAVFEHERNNRGQRINRTTIGKPKRSAYYKRICLVDGSDDKTHMIGLGECGGLHILSADMKHSDFSIYDSDPNYNEYKNELMKVTE